MSRIPSAPKNVPTGNASNSIKQPIKTTGRPQSGRNVAAKPAIRKNTNPMNVSHGVINQYSETRSNNDINDPVKKSTLSVISELDAR